MAQGSGFALGKNYRIAEGARQAGLAEGCAPVVAHSTGKIRVLTPKGKIRVGVPRSFSELCSYGKQANRTLTARKSTRFALL